MKTRAEFEEAFRRRSTDGQAIPAAVAPYLTAPLGLSAGAYEEWVDRLCAQPDGGVKP